MPHKDNSNKSVTKFKDLIKEMELHSINSNEEDVKKNTSSNNELSMMRFLMNQRNQFKR